MPKAPCSEWKFRHNQQNPHDSLHCIRQNKIFQKFFSHFRNAGERSKITENDKKVSQSYCMMFPMMCRLDHRRSSSQFWNSPPPKQRKWTCWKTVPQGFKPRWFLRACLLLPSFIPFIISCGAAEKVCSWISWRGRNIWASASYGGGKGRSNVEWIFNVSSF